MAGSELPIDSLAYPFSRFKSIDRMLLQMAEEFLMLAMEERLAGEATAQSGSTQKSAAINAGTVAFRINSGLRNWNGSLHACQCLICKL